MPGAVEITALTLLAINAAGTAGIFFRLGNLEARISHLERHTRAVKKEIVPDGRSTQAA